MTRPALAAIVVAALLPQNLPAQSGGPNAPRPGTFFLYPERVPLRGGGLAGAERGLLSVPATRADTGKGVIAIDVWRFRATTATNAPPIVLLHGDLGYEVEFVSLKGETLAVVSLTSRQVRPLGEREIAQARAVEAVAQ